MRLHAVTKQERNKLIKTLDSIETTKVKMATLRDRLREQVGDLEDILESIDAGVEAFEDADRNFRDGLDQMSAYL